MSSSLSVKSETRPVYVATESTTSGAKVFLLFNGKEPANMAGP